MIALVKESSGAGEATPRSEDAPDVAVLIAGAGPTGVVAAIELARRGAGAVSARSLPECLRR